MYDITGFNDALIVRMHSLEFRDSELESIVWKLASGLLAFLGLEDVYTSI